jgi:hypothetical protein
MMTGGCGKGWKLLKPGDLSREAQTPAKMEDKQDAQT